MEGLQPFSEWAYPSKVLCLHRRWKNEYGEMEESDENGWIPDGCACGGTEGMEDGEECDIGIWQKKRAGWLLDVSKPSPLYVQWYYCRTHGHYFSCMRPEFLEWLYGGTSGHSWEEVQPNPMVVKHGETYMTSEFLSSLVCKFEQRVTVYQIVEIVQQQWLENHKQALADYKRCLSVKQRAELIGCEEPQWVQERGTQLFTDRRTLAMIIRAYFNTFLRDDFERDLQTAREKFCLGISADETFKVALKCSYHVRGEDGKVNKYMQAPFCLQTVHSTVTQMAVHCSFLPGKAARDKQAGLRVVMEAQKRCRRSVKTKYVATDNAHGDQSMVRDLYADVFGASSVSNVDPVIVGDDQWHGFDRIYKHLSKRQKFKHKRRLQKVFKLVYQFADEVEPALGNGMSVEEVQAFGCGLFVAELQKWADGVEDGSAQVGSAVQACKQHAHYLFNFVPVYPEMQVIGTTANENGHFVLNRRTKFTTHMRPDHTIELVEYVMWLYNQKCALQAAECRKLTARQQAAVRGLFQRPSILPFARRAAQGVVPFVLLYSQDAREYSLEDYNLQFGASCNQAQLEGDGPLSVSSAESDGAISM